MQKDAIVQVFGLNFFDEFHPAEAGSNERLYRRQKALVCNRFIQLYAGSDKVFLDAGSGRGPYTYLAASKFKTVYCFEFDPEELSAARTNVGQLANVVYGQVDLRQIPLPDNSVDVAICSEVLEHISEEGRAAAELYRILKPSGRLLFSMPNRKSLFYQRVKLTHRIRKLCRRDPKTLSRGDWEALRHVTFSPKDIEAIVTTVGFIVLDRIGANIISLPGFLRRLMVKSKILLRLFTNLQELLARPLAKFGAFYFLELTK